MANTYKIAVIPGDGIGPEVISAGLTVLETLSSVTGTFTLDLEHFDWSSDKFKATGSYMPDDFLDVLRPKDAIFFGAVGDPNVPDHISLWSLLLPIRQRFQQYANVRPTRILRGTTSPLAGIKPEDLDWVLVRENSEGEYAGQGGRTHIGQDWEVGTELAIFSRHAIRRIFRFAFQTAEKRPRKLLTFVTKSNAQRSGMVLWDEVAYEVAAEFPHVKFDKMLVDAMTTRMVLHPKSLDTIVATNLHADILSDLAASLAGSIGIAPTSNLDPTRQAPSMFEPVHGSAPDISGKGIANPVATFWTAAEMLDWLGEPAAAKLLMEAVETVTGAGILTKDLGGSSNTVEVTTAVVDAIKKSVDFSKFIVSLLTMIPISQTWNLRAQCRTHSTSRSFCELYPSLYTCPKQSCSQRCDYSRCQRGKWSTPATAPWISTDLLHVAQDRGSTSREIHRRRRRSERLWRVFKTPRL
ncbi:hypothetical protein PLICRDRAFT_276163 [Plicaturopsis crispa FD-325 SS-3]|nr:hypothetical protein PLICRDRAFT_276163 [Plicaturopsis crispa FD-325 SS-3]